MAQKAREAGLMRLEEPDRCWRVAEAVEGGLGGEPAVLRRLSFKLDFAQE